VSEVARRPLIVLSGWRTPHLSAELLRRRLRDRAGLDDARTLAVSFFWRNSIESAAVTLRKAVHTRFGTSDVATPRVDVVALSMGGLVARRAAMQDRSLAGPRLHIARLFTLGTPHRGAKLASLVRVDQASREMRPGSAWLARLDAALVDADYELICYARLSDWMVGATRTAPMGHNTLWKPGPPIIAHHTLGMDRAILDDLAARLQGEVRALVPGLTAGPPPRD
jgi:pimeloyl-ACP methyl ester carboxylesterase